jgi:hypothetical protein
MQAGARSVELSMTRRPGAPSCHHSPSLASSARAAALSLDAASRVNRAHRPSREGSAPVFRVVPVRAKVERRAAGFPSANPPSRDAADEARASSKNMGSTGEETQITCKFVTRLPEKYRISPTPFAVPGKLTRYGLSEVINHLLALGA